MAENLRYREFPAISTQPKTTKPKTRVGGDSPAAPIPAMPQPEPLSKAKKRMSSYALKLQNQTPRPKAQGHPKTRNQKHVLEATPTAPLPHMSQPCPFSVAKSVCFRMQSNSGIKTRGHRRRAQTPGPRLQAPGLQGRSPRPQGPSSELQNLVLAARAHASYQKFIKSEGAHCAQRRTIFWALTAEQGRKPLVPNSHLQAAANDFL